MLLPELQFCNDASLRFTLHSAQFFIVRPSQEHDGEGDVFCHSLFALQHPGTFSGRLLFNKFY